MIGHIDIVKFLTVEKHCDPMCKELDKNTPLHMAAANGHKDIVDFFVSDQNCDLNILGDRGGTPLHYAAEWGHLHIVKYLIDEQGCNPSCLDEKKGHSTSLCCYEGTHGHCQVSYYREAL